MEERERNDGTVGDLLGEAGEALAALGFVAALNPLDEVHARWHRGRLGETGSALIEVHAFNEVYTIRRGVLPTQLAEAVLVRAYVDGESICGELVFSTCAEGLEFIKERIADFESRTPSAAYLSFPNDYLRDIRAAIRMTPAAAGTAQESWLQRNGSPGRSVYEHLLWLEQQDVNTLLRLRRAAGRAIRLAQPNILPAAGPQMPPIGERRSRAFAARIEYERRRRMEIERSLRSRGGQFRELEPERMRVLRTEHAKRLELEGLLARETARIRVLEEQNRELVERAEALEARLHKAEHGRDAIAASRAPEDSHEAQAAASQATAEAQEELHRTLDESSLDVVLDCGDWDIPPPPEPGELEAVESGSGLLWRRKVSGPPESGQLGAVERAEEERLPDANCSPRSSDADAYKVELCLFDLDNTLLRTDDLLPWRREQRDLPPHLPKLLVKLAEPGAEERYIYSQSVLESLRTRFPDMKFGVFTRSPRSYAMPLLERFFPDVRWDMTIAREDVPRTKPYPDGVREAMKRLGLMNARNVALVGNDKADVLAAYFSGCWSVIDRSSWGGRPDSEVLERIPDAVIDTPAELAEALADLAMRLPALEQRLASTATGSTREGRHSGRPRIELIPYTSPSRSGPRVEVAVLGRYFAAKDALTPRTSWHALTEQILAHKDAVDFPSEWTAAICDYLAGLTLDRGAVVTCIPGKPNGVQRVESLLVHLWVESLAFSTLPGVEVEVDEGVLAFRSGVASSHRMHLNRQQRFENVEGALYVAHPERIRGRQVVVIDDVVTSGATLVTASRLLTQAGAADVKCLAIAKTITDR